MATKKEEGPTMKSIGSSMPYQAKNEFVELGAALSGFTREVIMSLFSKPKMPNIDYDDLGKFDFHQLNEIIPLVPVGTPEYAKLMRRYQVALRELSARRSAEAAIKAAQQESQE